MVGISHRPLHAMRDACIRRARKVIADETRSDAVQLQRKAISSCQKGTEYLLLANVFVATLTITRFVGSTNH